MKSLSYMTAVLCLFAFFSCGKDDLWEQTNRRPESVPGETGFQVIYEGNGHTAGAPPLDDTYYHTDDTVIILVKQSGMIRVNDGINMRFLGWSRAVDDIENLYQPSSEISIADSDIIFYAIWTVIGGTGPAGGLVFYDRGEVINGWRYMEAAPQSAESVSIQWGGYGTAVNGTGADIGSGRLNTNLIIAAYGEYEPHAGLQNYASKIGYVSGEGGYNDWFLPSKNELDMMCWNLRGKRHSSNPEYHPDIGSDNPELPAGGIGGFSDSNYWSSSELSENSSWFQSFGDGYQGTGSGKTMALMVRPVRAFSSTQSSYIVSYHSNGAESGTQPVDPQFYPDGSSAIVYGPGTLVRDGYLFMGWNTEPDGTGTPYQEDDSITFSGNNFFLYASWEKEDKIFTVISNPSSLNDSPSSIVIDGDFIYVAGNDYQNGAGNQQWRIEKRCRFDGSLIEDFGNAGVVLSSPTSNRDVLSAIDIYGEHIYAGGYQNYVGSHLDNALWRIEKRNKNTGELVEGFGASGAVTHAYTDRADYLDNLKVNSDGIYAAGRYQQSDTSWNRGAVIERRNLMTGAFVPEFGSGGYVLYPVDGTNSFYGIEVDQNSVYIAGSRFQGSFCNWWHISRNRLNGAQNYSFYEYAGSTGTGGQYQYGLAIDSDYVYRVGDNSAGRWVIEKRNKSNGSLVTAFNGSGRITLAIASPEPKKARLNDSHLFVAGFDTIPGNRQWRVEKRDKNTGAFASGFGTGGVISVNPSSNHDILYALAIDENFIYAAGTDFSIGAGSSAWRLMKIDIETGDYID